VTDTAQVYSPDVAERRWSEMKGRFLNHAELVYAPGERELAMALFELLGFEVKDTGLRSVLFGVDGPGQTQFSNNAIYASEMMPEQHALAEALRKAAASPEIAPLFEAFESRRHEEPQWFPQFGMRLSEQAQADVLERIEALDDPRFKGRISVRVFGRGDELNAAAPGLRQAFVFTDIVFGATVPGGPVFELQVVVDESILPSRTSQAKALG
jgi:hypothetical protein